MLATSRNSGPAQGAQVAPVFHEARLCARHVWHGITAEPERIVSARRAGFGRLGKSGAKIRRRKAGQQSSQRNCELNRSTFSHFAGPHV